MSARQVDVFFYGLYMDVEVLRQSGASPSNPRRAYVENFALRIGQRATLVPQVGARVYGMLISLARADIDRLYSAPGLDRYRPEAVLVHPQEGRAVPALCYNLQDAPESHERNPEYALRLQGVLGKLGFSIAYIDSVE